LPKPATHRDLATTIRNRCGDRQPSPTRKRDRRGGRNARATRHAFARIFRTVLRRFTLENHRLLQALPQSSGKLRKLSRFRCSHSPSQPRPPQQKRCSPLCRNCGRKLFLVETRGKLRTNQDYSQRGCPVLVRPFFGRTEPALSEAEGAGNLTSAITASADRRRAPASA
jgi:hypothetical protein